MRNAIFELTNLLPNAKASRIRDYIQEQYNRIAITPKSEVSISLHDCNETDVVSLLRRTLAQYELTFNQLQESVWIVPVIDRIQNRIVPIVEFKAAFFESIFNDEDVDVESIILNDSDAYEFAGTGSHISYTKAQSSDRGKLVAAAVNASFDGADRALEASCWLVAEELEQIKSQYIKVKFGGINLFTELEWEDIFKSCVYRRLMRESAFYLTLRSLRREALRKLELAREDHNAFFTRQKESASVVRDSFSNRVIGRKFKLYSAEDVAKARQERRIVTPTATAKQGTVVSFPAEPEKAKGKKRDAVAESTNSAHDAMPENTVLTTMIDESFNGANSGFEDNDNEIWFDDIEELMDI